MELFNFIASLCSIISFVISLFIVAKVYNINLSFSNKSFLSGNKKLSVNKATVTGDITLGNKGK